MVMKVMMVMVSVVNVMMVVNLVQPPKGWAGVEGERLAKEWGGELGSVIATFTSLLCHSATLLAFPDTLLLCYPASRP